MKMYTLKSVRRDLGSFSLKIDECRLERGEVYAIVGPNGCGKSTLLNLLGLVDPPAEGTVVMDGNSVDFADSEGLIRTRRRIGYLMQAPYLFNMSVRDNVGYGLKVRGHSRKAVRERTDKMLSSMLLAHLADRPAHTLSGGEAQRVALARTLVLDVDAFLLDEPTANVDCRNIHVVEALILRLNRETRATIVLSTHSREQAYRMSRNLISIIDGRIRDIVYENVFSGVLREENDGLRTVRLADNVEFKVGQGEEGHVTIAIDPGDILISNEEIRSSALNRFTGTITKIEDVNGSIRVFVDTGVSLCALITRRSFLDMDMNIGRSVWVTFKANAVKVI